MALQLTSSERLAGSALHELAAGGPAPIWLHGSVLCAEHRACLTRQAPPWQRRRRAVRFADLRCIAVLTARQPSSLDGLGRRFGEPRASAITTWCRRSRRRTCRLPSRACVLSRRVGRRNRESPVATRKSELCSRSNLQAPSPCPACSLGCTTGVAKRGRTLLAALSRGAAPAVPQRAAQAEARAGRERMQQTRRRERSTAASTLVRLERQC
jgi:hypothetical protein